MSLFKEYNIKELLRDYKKALRDLTTANENVNATAETLKQQKETLEYAHVEASSIEKILSDALREAASTADIDLSDAIETGKMTLNAVKKAFV